MDRDWPTLGDSYGGKTVWLSGHTGFKGAWLALWLEKLGATVHGFSFEPPTQPSLFEQVGVQGPIRHRIGDIREPRAVSDSIRTCEPDFVFHLAAQALVRPSFQDPVRTYQTNVRGTINVLEALRTLQRPCAAVLVTSDKCYLNTGLGGAFNEDDPLGGMDPYSSSKAAAEIVIASWRDSFLKDGPARVASARAGNCIGGGDWAEDRIVPDCIRSLQQGEPICVRNPRATRPWQHVLEPLFGYLQLGSALASEKRDPRYESAFNFGPDPSSERTVEKLVAEVLKHWPGSWEDAGDPAAPHEAALLSLDAGKAKRFLGWRSIWSFEQAVEKSVAWYRAAETGSVEELREFTLQQIEDHEIAADCAGTSSAPS